MTWFIISYMLLLNGLSGYLMYDDKRRSVANRWRIPERELLYLCLAGGFFGTYWGMKVARHKTQHWYFHCAVIVAFLFWLFVVPFSYYWWILR